MSKLVWDDPGKKVFETGVDHGVLYPKSTSGTYPEGVPWNGLTGVTESPSGAEPTPFYADNIKYANIQSAEEYGATIEAYTYPKEFEPCDGSAEIVPGVNVGQQERQAFGFVYRTKIGNDIAGSDYGYKLHLVYECLASPSEKGYQTVNDTPELMTFSWEVSTTPVPVTNHKPTACLTLDSTVLSEAQLKKIEDILFGVDASGETPATKARLPLPDEIATIVSEG